MRLSSLTGRIGGEGARAWEIHVRAIELRRRGKEVILLSVGDPDFATPPSIVDRCIASLQSGNTHYTGIAGQPELRRAIAMRHTATTGLDTAPEQVVVFSGAQNALFAAAMCLFDSGDEVIVPEPMYVTYEAVIGATRATIVRVPLPRERNFHPDLAALSAAATSRTRGILMNTPNNPTGVVLTAGELAAVADLCCRHDLWLISDEVYATLAFEREHLSPCTLPGMAGRTVTVSSLSKSHAMTGWRVGWTVSPPELVPHLRNLALCMLYGSPGFIQDAAIGAVEREPPEIAGIRNEIEARRNLVCDHLKTVPGLVCLRPEGGMFVMLDIRDTGLSGHDFAAGLLENHAVSLLPADAFGPSARGHVRMSLTADRATLAEACDRIANFAKDLRARQNV